MNVFEMIAMSAAGVALVACASFAIYAVLPHGAQTLAGKHGRYTGLGSADQFLLDGKGHRAATPVAGLQSQSA